MKLRTHSSRVIIVTVLCLQALTVNILNIANKKTFPWQMTFAKMSFVLMTFVLMPLVLMPFVLMPLVFNDIC